MAKGKSSSSKPAGKFAVKAGGSGKMKKFGGAVPQQPGVSATSQGSGKGNPFAKAGPSGKMHGFSPVKPQKSGRSSQS
jgi:hypothetical protein